jgi:hypothetical protein
VEHERQRQHDAEHRDEPAGLAAGGGGRFAVLAGAVRRAEAVLSSATLLMGIDRHPGRAPVPARGMI